jgi:hypothetical protein
MTELAIMFILAVYTVTAAMVIDEIIDWWARS